MKILQACQVMASHHIVHGQVKLTTVWVNRKGQVKLCTC